MRRLLVLLALIAGVAMPAHGQVKGVRFEITQVGDTTLSFAVGTASWVRKGLTGIAVDPHRRDALVAQFRIVGVDQGVVNAVITGQTTRVAVDHIAILQEPPPNIFRAAKFWGAVVAGFALGLVVGHQF